MTALSVIIPANNEADYIETCLESLLQQDIDLAASGGGEIILVANACSDETVPRAESARKKLEAAQWRIVILNLQKGGKLNALNQGDRQAQGRVLVYLDADVICEPAMMRHLVTALDIADARYASGQLKVTPARSWVTTCFSKVWVRLPFMTTNVQGAGLFAVNRAGRNRWGSFPDIIADDGFVRLTFTPNERIKVDAAYHWPLAEGFRKLVKVRRRQDAGVRELSKLYPALMRNESKPPMTINDHLRLFFQTPLSYLIYISVIIAVKVGSTKQSTWVRGR